MFTNLMLKVPMRLRGIAALIMLVPLSVLLVFEVAFNTVLDAIRDFFHAGDWETLSESYTLAWKASRYGKV